MSQEITSGNPLEYATQYINTENEIDSTELIFAGTMDIIAEVVCERADIRSMLRKYLWQNARIQTELPEENEASQAFLMYKEYSEPLKTLPSHRILAINRGEKKNFLKVRLDTDHEKNLSLILNKVITKPSIFSEIITAAVSDGYKRLFSGTGWWNPFFIGWKNAETQAIHVFGLNLKQLLLQAPLSGNVVMGLDPGYRTGCKMAVIDATGHVLDHGVLYLTMSDDAKAKAAETTLALIKKYNVTLISIGNGTASYETEEFTAIN